MLSVFPLWEPKYPFNEVGSLYLNRIHTINLFSTNLLHDVVHRFWCCPTIVLVPSCQLFLPSSCLASHPTSFSAATCCCPALLLSCRCLGPSCYRSGAIQPPFYRAALIMNDSTTGQGNPLLVLYIFSSLALILTFYTLFTLKRSHYHVINSQEQFLLITHKLFKICKWRAILESNSQHSGCQK